MPSQQLAEHHASFVAWHPHVGAICSVKLTDGSHLVGELACVDPATANLLLIEVGSTTTTTATANANANATANATTAEAEADAKRRATLVFGQSVVSCSLCDEGV
mmetsp:Transcript_60549/g.166292  ORF Transcript_60549/g.166292 Transcript_60549/m.166292 type:complete len:105 (+) Transcript_60549:149-463(+)